MNRPEMEDNAKPEGKKSVASLIHCWGEDKLAHAFYGHLLQSSTAQEVHQPCYVSRNVFQGKN